MGWVENELPPTPPANEEQIQNDAKKRDDVSSLSSSGEKRASPKGTPRTRSPQREAKRFIWKGVNGTAIFKTFSRFILYLAELKEAIQMISKQKERLKADQRPPFFIPFMLFLLPGTGEFRVIGGKKKTIPFFLSYPLQPRRDSSQFRVSRF